LWSAHRDPSFGFATLVIESAHVARLKWFRNADAADEVADETTYERLASCPNARNLNPTTQVRCDGRCDQGPAGDDLCDEKTDNQARRVPTDSPYLM